MSGYVKVKCECGMMEIDHDFIGVATCMNCKNQYKLILMNNVLEVWMRRLNLKTDKYPDRWEHADKPKKLSQYALELCWSIEKLPASKQQTNTSTLASELMHIIEVLEERKLIRDTIKL